MTKILQTTLWETLRHITLSIKLKNEQAQYIYKNITEEKKESAMDWVCAPPTLNSFVEALILRVLAWWGSGENSLHGLPWSQTSSLRNYE